MTQDQRRHFVVFWGRGDEVKVELWLPQPQWSSVLGGAKLHLAGSGYYYEGDFFLDDWYFNEPKEGDLTVTYTDDAGDSGDGYLGPIGEAVMNADGSDET